MAMISILASAIFLSTMAPTFSSTILSTCCVLAMTKNQRSAVLIGVVAVARNSNREVTASISSRLGLVRIKEVTALIKEVDCLKGTGRREARTFPRLVVYRS